MANKFLHQAFALGSMYWISMTIGFIYGQTTGMVRALQKNEDDINLSDNDITLIASTIILVAPIGYGLSAVVADNIGRRWSFILFSVPIIICSSILYYAKNMFMFMISRIIAGIATGALMMLYICTTSEYTSQNMRGFFLNMITTVAPAIGTGLGHFLGIILHWRSVAIIETIFAIPGIILPYFWIESPHWLALKGRFDECQAAFRKLHIIDEESERELRMLIKMENNKLDKITLTNSKSTLKKLVMTLKRKYIWKVISLSSALFIYITAAGKVMFSTFETVILEEMTGTPDVLLFTLFVDGSILIGSILSCILMAKRSMRELLFSTGFTANAVLIILSACLYFNKDEVYFQWLNICLLALYFILVNTGPYPIDEALLSEIFPSDLKFYCIFLLWTIVVGSLTASIMLLPHMVNAMGYHGLFLFNAVIMSVSLAYVWVKLPETKGKTLQEIEVYFKTNDFDVDKALENEQINKLI